MKANQRPMQNGFTLLEVVVALVILALTMTGLVKSIGDGANIQGRLEERTIAQWVALNQVARMQLVDRSPPIGNSNGTSEMAGRNWHWQQEITTSSDALVNRITVTAGLEGGADEVASVVGYLWVERE